MPSFPRARATLALLASFVLWMSAMPAAWTQSDERRREQEFNFDAQGIQPGQTLPDLTVYALDGQPRQVAEFWNDRPLVLVSSSLSCPVSRRRLGGVEQLARRFGDQISVLVLYTIEAHPVGSHSPYAPREWITPQNKKEGILCAQPTTLAQRLDLARQLQSRLQVSVPILVDGMDNRAWNRLGGGPNMGFFVRLDGVVEIKQGGFDGPSMEQAITSFLER